MCLCVCKTSSLSVLGALKELCLVLNDIMFILVERVTNIWFTCTLLLSAMVDILELYPKNKFHFCDFHMEVEVNSILWETDNYNNCDIT